MSSSNRGSQFVRLGQPAVTRTFSKRLPGGHPLSWSTGTGSEPSEGTFFGATIEKHASRGPKIIPGSSGLAVRPVVVEREYERAASDLGGMALVVVGKVRGSWT